MITGKKLAVALLLLMDYACLNAVRTTWGYSKTQMNTQSGLSLSFLGLTDTLYVIMICCGMFILGSYIHHFTMRQYAIGGVVFSAVPFLVFPVLWIAANFANQWLIGIMLAISGFFKATSWPGVLSFAGVWYDRDPNKAKILAFISMGLNFAGFYGSYLSNLLENLGYGFAANLFVMGGISLLTALFMYLFLSQKPKQQQNSSDIQLQEKILPQQALTPTEEETWNQEELKVKHLFDKYGIIAALTLPRVPVSVSTYCLIKACSYSFIFWVPTYLSTRSEEVSTQRGYNISMNDVGSVVGSFALGALLDRSNRRASILFPFMVVSTCALMIVSWLPSAQPLLFYLTLLVVGLTLGSTYNTISTVLSLELGSQIKGKGMVGKVSSLMEGLSALFGSIILNVIPLLSRNSLFYLLTLMSLIATILIYKLALTESPYFQSGQTAQSKENQ